MRPRTKKDPMPPPAKETGTGPQTEAPKGLDTAIVSREILELRARLEPEQSVAVWRLSRRMGCDLAETQRRLISLALFAVGLDHSAEADLTAVAEAAVGQEGAATIFNAIAESNADSWHLAASVTRIERNTSRVV